MALRETETCLYEWCENNGRHMYSHLVSITVCNTILQINFLPTKYLHHHFSTHKKSIYFKNIYYTSLRWFFSFIQPQNKQISKSSIILEEGDIFFFIFILFLFFFILCHRFSFVDNNFHSLWMWQKNFVNKQSKSKKERRKKNKVLMAQGVINYTKS